MVYLITVLIIIVAIFFVVYTFAGITFNGLPVLMYHKVIDEGIPDYLTITIQDLEQQFKYLVKRGYTSILLSDLLDHLNEKKKLPAKAVLLTFDDGYKNNFTQLYPLLKKYNLKANIFLVAGFIQPSVNNLQDQNEFLHIDDIKEMSSDTVQFGLHSYDHKSYNELTISQIEEDIRSCRTQLNHLNIPYQPCLAYTYGAFPKKDSKKREQMFVTMQATGVQCAFRIGNRINKLPIQDKFLIQRIDVRGDESFARFKVALIAGKKIFFK